jgi:hypothetical protein
MTGTKDDPESPRDEHPVLTPEQDTAARGQAGKDTLGGEPPVPPKVASWQVAPDLAEQVEKGLGAALGGMKGSRRDAALPYLLVRGYAPGDRGVRPIPYPPIPFWESPDIYLNLTNPGQAEGEPQGFDRSRLVESPDDATAYRVFVHVWNLGRFPAYGVRVQVWWVDPGFFNPYNPADTRHYIGGAYVDLPDRSHPDCHRIVEIPTSWHVESNMPGHECLLAAVDCAADRWGGTLDADRDRHVAQHNVSIISGTEDMSPLIGYLAERLSAKADLEIIHAGKATAAPIDIKFGGGLAAEGLGVTQLVAPGRLGVPVASGGVHLATVTQIDGKAALVPTYDVAALQTLARKGLLSPLPPEILDQLDPSVLLTAESRSQVPALLESFLQIPDLKAATVANALDPTSKDGHVLRFVAVEDGQVSGGYTVVLSPS